MYEEHCLFILLCQRQSRTFHRIEFIRRQHTLGLDCTYRYIIVLGQHKVYTVLFIMISILFSENYSMFSFFMYQQPLSFKYACSIKQKAVA